MTPILGIMLGIVLVDKKNFLFSFGLVLAGAGTAVLIGLILGYAFNNNMISADNNSQVSSRVEPRITDLIGALATGTVGAIALVRKDVAGSLPGVAIAISLVPPLCVVGLTLSTGHTNDAIGALLLFATNFGSILLTGIIVMFIYRVPFLDPASASARSSFQRAFGTVLVVSLLAVIAVPLTYTSMRVGQQYNISACLQDKIDAWGVPVGWRTQIVVTQFETGNTYRAEILLTGTPPLPEDADLTSQLQAVAVDCGVIELTIRYIPQYIVEV